MKNHYYLKALLFCLLLSGGLSQSFAQHQNALTLSQFTEWSLPDSRETARELVAAVAEPASPAPVELTAGTGVLAFRRPQAVVTSISSGNWNNTGTWSCGCIPGAGDQVTIVAPHVVSLTDDRTVDDITIDAGAQLTIQNNDRITLNNNLTVNGLIELREQGTPEVSISMNGNGGILDGAGTIFTSNSLNNNNSPIIRFSGNTVIAATADLTITQNDADNPDFILIASFVTVTNNGTVRINENLTGQAFNSSWINAAGSTLEIEGTLMSTGIFNASAAGNTVNYAGLSSQTIKTTSARIYHNLILSGSGTKTLGTNTIINGNLTISSTLEPNGFDLAIAGDWTNTGVYNSGTEELTFNGTSDQQINSTIRVDVFDLVVQKSGSTLSTNQDIVVSNSFTLNNANLDMGSNRFTLGTSTANVGTYSRVAPATIIGEFERFVNGSNSTSMELPVGTATNYNGVEVTFNDLTSGSIIAEFVEASPGPITNPPLNDDGIDINNTYLDGYWRLTKNNGLNSVDYDLSLTANGFDNFTVTQDTRILFRANSAADWTLSGTHVNTGFVSPVARRTTFGSLSGEYALAENNNCDQPTTSAISGNSVVCVNDAGETYSVVATTNSTYTWQVTGGSIVGSSSGLNLNSITVNWGATGGIGTVTVTENNSTAVNGCGEGEPVSLDVQIDAVPTSVITGDASVSQGATAETYSVSNTPGYTYTWALSGGGTIASGQGSNQITVDWGSTTGSFTLSVSAESPAPCSQTAADVTLDVSVVDVILSIANGDWNNAGTWEGGNVPGTGENARIVSGFDVRLTDDRFVEDLEIEAGATLEIQNNDRLTVEGDLTVNGTIDMREQGTPEVDLTMIGNGAVLDGTGDIILTNGLNNNNSPVITFAGNVTIAATANLSFSQLDNDNPDFIRVNSNSVITNNGTVSINENLAGGNSNSTWINTAGSSLSIGGTLLSTGTLDAAAVGNTVTYNGGAAQVIKNPQNSQYYNLTLTGTGDKSLQANTTITGDLSFSSTLNSTGFDINLGGNWTNTGLFTEGNQTVTLNGTGNQTVTSTVFEEFFNLVISKNGSTVTLGSDVQVDNSLTIENTLINTGANTLTLGSGISQLGSLSRTAPATIIGKFERWVNVANQSNLLFPVGTSGQFRPLEVTFNNLNAGSLIAEFVETNPGPIVNAPLDDNGLDLNNTYLEGYWTLTRDNALSSNDYDLSLTAAGFNTFSISNDTRIVTRANSSSNWGISGTHDNAGFTEPVVRRANVALLSAEFTLAENDNCALPATGAITGNTEVCINDTGETYTTTGTLGSSFTWEVTGGTIVGSSTGVNLTSINVDWGSSGIVGTITVTEDNSGAGGCGVGEPVSLSVNVGPVPTSEITGSSTVTANNTGSSYSVTATPGYTYTWAISGSGGSITSGQGSNAITIDWGTTTGNFTVSVVATAPAPCSEDAPAATLSVEVIEVIESQQTGNWNSTATWLNGVVPGSGNAVRINPTHTVTVTADRFASDVEVQLGATLLIQNNDLLTVEGNLTVNGTIESREQGTPEANIRMTGSAGVLDGNGVIEFTAGLNNNNSAIFFFDNNTTIAASADLTFDMQDPDAPDFIEVSNDVIVTNNGRITINENLAGGNGNSIWINADGSTLSIGGDVMRTGVLNTKASTNTLVYNGTANQTVTATLDNEYGNLTLAGSGIKSVESALTIQGNLTISSTFNSNGNDLTLSGNWTNTGSFTEGTQTVTLNGTADQTITSALDEVFHNLIISKGTGDVLLSNNATVANTLNLSSGNINTGANTLTLGTGTGVLGSLMVTSPAHVIGNFERWVAAANQTDLIFPVGSATETQPVTVTFNNLNPGSIIASFVTSDPGAAGLPLEDDGETLNNTYFVGYWTLSTANSLTSTDYNVAVEGNGFDSNPFAISTAHLLTRANSSSNWIADGNHVAAVGNIVARTNVTTLSAEYGLATSDNCDISATASIAGESSPCIGDTETYTAVGGNAGSTYTWTVTGGTIDGGVATGAGLTSINVTWGSTGGAGTITVVENNNFDPVFGCGDGATIELSVDINPVPTSIISGAALVSIDQTGTVYSVTNTTGYTYTWTLPEGGTISAGQGTNSITIDWSSNPGTYTLSVLASSPAPCSQNAAEVSLDITVLDEIRSVATGDWNQTGTWEGGLIPTASDNARILNTHVVTVTADRFITNLAIDEGGVLNIQNNDLITISGNLTINGELRSQEQGTPEVNVRMNGDGGILDGIGTINYVNGLNNNNDRIFHIDNNITIAATADLTFTQFDADNQDMIQISNNVIVTNLGAVTLNYNIFGENGNATWINGADATLNIGGVLLQTGTLDASAAGNTINYNGNQTQNIKTAVDGYHNLQLTGSGSKSLQSATSMSGDLQISSELALSGFDLTIEGDWNNTGTFTPGANAIIFFGTNEQTLTNASGETFFNFTLNKATGSLTLANNAAVTNQLTMFEGTLNTGANTFTLGTNAITEGTLAHTSGTIVGNFQRFINSASSFLFPVGTATDFRPATIVFDGVTTGGSLTASFEELAPGNNGLPITDGAVTVQNTFSEGYWSIAMPNSIGFTTYDIDLTGNSFNSFAIDADTRVLSRTNSAAAWAANGTHVAASGVVAQRDNIATLPLEFVFADDTPCDLPATSAITRAVAGTNCIDDTGVVYQVTNTPGSTYTWAVAGGTITSGQGTNAITITWGSVGGTFTISVTEDNSATVNGCGVGSPVTLDVDVSPIATSAISGRNSVAANTTGVAYSVVNTPGYTYAWTATGGTVITGDGTNSVTVNWGATGTGQLSVIATNTDCGLSAAAVELEVEIFPVIQSNGTGGGNWNNGSSWSGGNVPQSTNSAQVLSGDEIRITGDHTIDNLIIDAGGVMRIDNNDRIDINGDFTLNGTVNDFENGTPEANMVMNGAGAILSGTGSFNAGLGGLNNNNSAVFFFSGNTTIASGTDITFTQSDPDNPGYIQIDNNVIVTNNGTITIDRNLIGGGSNAQWINGTGGTLNIGNQLLNTGILFANQAGNTVNYNGTGAQSIKSPSGNTYANLSLSGSGNKSLQANTVVTETLNNAATLLANGFNLEMRSAWVNTGTFTPGTSTVTFNGTGAQSITNAAGEIFFNLVVNTNGGSLTLNNNVQVTNGLTLTLGDVITGVNVLTLGTNAISEGTLTRSSGAINGRFERFIQNTGAEFLWPLTDGTNYLPAEITFNSISTPGPLTGNFNTAAPGSVGFPITDGGDVVQGAYSEGFWEFSSSAAFSSTDYNADVTGNGFSSFTIDPTGLTRLIVRADGAAAWPDPLPGTHVNGTGSEVQRDNVDQDFPADFALGDLTACPTITTSAISGAQEVCTSATEAYSVISTAGSFYNWTITGGVIDENGATTYRAQDADISITWSATGGERTITVTEEIDCGGTAVFGTQQDLAINVNPIPGGPISGSFDLATQSIGETYSVFNRTGYSYQWSTAEGNITGSSTSNSVDIDWTTTNATGTLTLTITYDDAVAVCGAPIADEVINQNINFYDVIPTIASGDWNDPSVWICNCIPDNNADVSISNGNTVTLVDNSINIADLTIDAGAFFDNGGFNITVNRDYANNGTHQGLGTTFLRGNLSNVTGSGSKTAGILRFTDNDKSLDGSANLTLGGTVQIASSVQLTNNGTLTLTGTLDGDNSSNATFINATGGTLNVSSPGNILMGSAGRLEVAATNNTVNYNATGDQSITIPNGAPPRYANLEIGGTGNKSLVGETSAQNLTINGGAFVPGANTFNLSGNWTNTSNSFTTGTSTISLNGSSSQVISNGTGTETFHTLEVNNSTSLSGGVSPATNQTIAVTNQLILTDGYVQTTATEQLTLLSGATVNLNAANQNQSYVNGPVNAEVSATGPSTVTFPVGSTETSFHRADVTVTHDAATSTLYTGQYITADANGLASSAGLPDAGEDLQNVSNLGYWRIEKGTGANLVSATATFYYTEDDGVGDFTQLRMAKADNESSAWASVGGSGSSNIAGTITTDPFTTFSIFSLSQSLGGANPLPVELIYFSGALNNGETILSWATASELNNDFFSIEKSIDGRVFETIGTVQGAGNTTEVVEYGFTDRDPFIGANYYRLRQTDFDGTTAYSNIIFLEYLSEEPVDYKVFPNPTTTNEFIAAVVGLLPGQQVSLRITDLAGRSYGQSSFTADLAGKVYETVRFPQSTPAGTYLVTVSTPGFTQYLRLVKR